MQVVCGVASHRVRTGHAPGTRRACPVCSHIRMSTAKGKQKKMDPTLPHAPPVGNFDAYTKVDYANIYPRDGGNVRDIDFSEFVIRHIMESASKDAAFEVVDRAGKGPSRVPKLTPRGTLRHPWRHLPRGEVCCNSQQRDKHSTLIHKVHPLPRTHVTSTNKHGIGHGLYYNANHPLIPASVAPNHEIAVRRQEA